MKKLIHNIRIGLFLLIFVIDTSCRDENDSKFTSIEGQVIDYYTNVPLSDIKIIIEKCNYNLINPSICNIFDTIFSDSLGYFQFNLDYSRYTLDGTYFQIIAIGSDNHSNSTFKEIKVGETNIYEFKLKPYRDLKIELIDSSMLYSEILIQIRESDNDSCSNGDLNYCFNESKDVLNPNENRYIYFKIIPETRLTLHWTCVTSDDNFEYKQRDIYFENQDTSYYELAY